jgi:hypothetical protein
MSDSVATLAIPTAAPNLAARLGIDWADKKHCWALQVVPAAGQAAGKIERGELEHTPAALDKFFTALAARFPGQQIAVALEQSHGALLFAVTKYPHVVAYPVHPNTLDHYRKGFYPSGAKSDPTDTDLILDLLVKHPEQLRKFEPDTVPTRTLQFLVEARRSAVDDNTRCSNRLTQQLKMYFPQVLDWFEVEQVVTGHLLLEWPTLEQLQQVKPQRLVQWLRQHRVSEARAVEVQQAVASAVALTCDAAVIECGALTVGLLVRQMQVLAQAIAQFDGRIAALAAEHPDRAIFASLPGAGEVMVPRLIAAFGTRRERFENAAQMQCYAGIAPVTDSSGKKRWVHWRWACPKFLRQTFQEWAGFTVRRSEWAREYYDRQRAKGKSHHAAVRALAYKWMRIVFRCWKDGVPYDEARYLKSLQKHAKPVQIPVKQSAGLTRVGELFA